MSQGKIAKSLNNLARLFYADQGYRVAEGYDFSQATHPHERSCWSLALIAWEHFRGDTPDFAEDEDEEESLDGGV